MCLRYVNMYFKYQYIYISIYDIEICILNINVSIYDIEICITNNDMCIYDMIYFIFNLTHSYF